MWTLQKLVWAALLLGLVAESCYGSRLIHEQCYSKWLTGYKLATGRPTKVLKSVSLYTCEQECLNTKGCAAFAYGVAAQSNGTCELATRMIRDSRSVSNITLSYDDLNKDNSYDVYIESKSDGCLPTSPLFQSPSNSLQGSSGGVPIDCFYRLMSGKRLSKTHVLKAVSVNNLQDCQEACIAEKSFVCRAISYRYMATGYTYNVANCDLSPFYLVNFDDTSRTKYDFVDDYDYDFFQREPHCKTTSSIGAHLGVCALVSRRGAKLNNLVKSAHYVSTPSQCEHLCTTALFRCRAFSFRHTERGRERDPFHRRDASTQQDFDNCFLHDVDITRLPAHNIMPDPDYDLFEMGRLMGHDCVLYDQYVSRKPGDFDDRRDTMHRYPPPPPTSGSGRDRDTWNARDRPPPYDDRRDRYPSGGGNQDYHGRRPGPYDRAQDRHDTPGGGAAHLPRPGIATDIGGSSGGSLGTTGPSGISDPFNNIHHNPVKNEKPPSAPASLEYLPPRYPSPSPPPTPSGPDYLEKNTGSPYHDVTPPSYVLQGPHNQPPEQRPRLPPPVLVGSNPITPNRPGLQYDRQEQQQQQQQHQHQQDMRGDNRDFVHRNFERDPPPANLGVDRSREQGNVNGAYPQPPLPPQQHITTTSYMIHGGGGPQQHHESNSNGQAYPPGPPGAGAGGPSLTVVTPVYNDQRPVSTTPQPPFYDKNKEVCLVRFKQDAYLAPEQSRATFPVKTLEECRVECLRSMEVLRFPCKTMSFRLTSNTGGSCQLSDMDERDLRPSDFMTARDRYDNAVIYSYDERADPTCRREDMRYMDYNNNNNNRNYYGDRPGYTYVGSTSTSMHYDNNRRFDTGSRYDMVGQRYDDRRHDDRRHDDRRHDDRRHDDRFQSGRPYSTDMDRNSRYGMGGASYNDRDRYMGGNSKGFYDDRRVDDYNRYGYYLPGNQGSRYNAVAPSPAYPPPPYRGSGSEAPTDDRTVNGERCMRSCRQNREAGFYYCQVDESGSWDFCCRPDHFCGYSRGLAVPWCYVGSGPSHNIWRSCNHRALYDRNPQFSPTVSYLHDRLPPTVSTLTNTQIANLTKDNALILFNGSPADFKLDTNIASSEVFSSNTSAPAAAHRAHALHDAPDVVQYGNILEDEHAQSTPTNSTRTYRGRSPRKHVRVVKVSKRVPVTQQTPSAE